MSVAWGARTSSAYDVMSMFRAALPEFEMETRRTSLSFSVEISTSKVVFNAPLLRVNSARSSLKTTV